MCDNKIEEPEEIEEEKKEQIQSYYHPQINEKKNINVANLI